MSYALGNGLASRCRRMFLNLPGSRVRPPQCRTVSSWQRLNWLLLRKPRGYVSRRNTCPRKRQSSMRASKGRSIGFADQRAINSRRYRFAPHRHFRFAGIWPASDWFVFTTAPDGAFRQARGAHGGFYGFSSDLRWMSWRHRDRAAAHKDFPLRSPARFAETEPAEFVETMAKSWPGHPQH